MWLKIKAQITNGTVIALYNYESDYKVNVFDILPAKYKKEIADRYNNHIENMRLENKDKKRDISQDPYWSNEFEVNIDAKELYSRVIESLLEVNKMIRLEISQSVYNQVNRAVKDMSYWVESVKKEMKRLETG
jgi:3-oxoacyl-[acyl-carrier-protein] synthase III